MSAYATAAQMLTWFDMELLAMAASSRDLGHVDSGLLRLTVAAGDRSAYSADQIAAGDAALEKIETALDDAADEVESYIRGRHTLPLDADMVSASGLPRRCGDIALYLLVGSQDISNITDRYDRAIRWLKDVSAGRAELAGANLPANATSSAPQYIQGTAFFGDLKGY